MSLTHSIHLVLVYVRTQLPQAAGVAYSLKMDGKEACVVAFTGDGGTGDGDFHVALNFAAVMEAPVMFICRCNNGWAVSTPISQQFRSS
ncbi:thiamine diphosphate-binding fold superfamily protein [Perilla frutescens var. hirtella]|nr:thiamine diphosphate-binding fold superfamily protein [Perilla frutescens var. hirtella]